MTPTKQDVRNAFYQIGREHHTTLTTLPGFEDAKPFVFQTIMEMLADGEVWFVHDDATPEAAFIFYRRNDGLMMAYIFRKENGFEFVPEACIWVHPQKKVVQPFETAQLLLVLEANVRFQGIELHLRSAELEKAKRLIGQAKTDAVPLSARQARNVKVLAYGVYYSLLVAFVPLYLLGFVLYLHPYSGVLSLCFGLFLYGCYLLLGALLRFRHIYCLYQNANHLPMTPEDVHWNTLNRSDYYGVPAVFMVMGATGTVLSLLAFAGIID
ncbi:MAG TPA: hypothetical protein DCR44_05070 [Acholeplasmatales bacterium]|nr:hypothetical protein [Acholeplasmatales bacterium]